MASRNPWPKGSDEWGRWNQIHKNDGVGSVQPGSPLADSVLHNGLVPTLKLPGGKNVRVAGLSAGNIDVPQIQRFLKSKGYDLPQTGQLDRTTRHALADFINPKEFGGGPLAAALQGTRITGARDPQAWNKRFGTPTTKSQTFRPNSGPGGSLGKLGNDVTNQYANGTVDLRGLGAIAQGLGTDPIPESLAKKLANDTAGAQYDSQIHDLQVELARDPVQAAQNLADIGNWYGQVGSARKTAAGRDTAISSAGVNSLKDALAAIESSIGGSANQGAADVGAAGANDIGTLQALGANQDQYNADLAPLLALESASAKQRQNASDTLVQQNHDQQLRDAQGSRGKLYGSTYDNALMDILDKNNALKQQGFNNKLAIQQAAEAAQISGLKALQYAQNASAAPKGSFGSATASDINGVQNAALKHVLDANGNLLPGMTAAKAAALVRGVASTYFPQGGVPMSWATQVVSPFFSS